MYRTILVPLDGSHFSEEALPLGALLARTLGAELHLAHVIHPSYDVDFKTPQEDLDWRQEVRDGATGYLEALASELREQGVSTLTSVLEGRTIPALTDYAASQEIDLIVLTTHGSGGVRRWWLGSVADGLVREGGVDLLLVRPWDETRDRGPGRSRFDRVLVPVDGSELAEAALEPARMLAAHFGAEVRATRVVPKPLELTSIYGVPGVEISGEGHERRMVEARQYLEGLVQGFPNEAIDGVAIEGTGAAEGVVEAAKAWNADLIVLSSHGRGGGERIVLGSVADKVIRATTRPVLVVRAAHDN